MVEETTSVEPVSMLAVIVELGTPSTELVEPS